MSNELEGLDIFDNVDANSEALDFLEKKSSTLDGIFRPKITDKKKGYSATIRFLPNLTKEGKASLYAIEKHQHYVDFKTHPELSGYYDCEKNYKDKCDLCTMYWKLAKSNNAADVEKAELIKRNTKYYSYILVVEDEQNKDLEGKILIYPYGYKIKEKIKDQREGISGEPCNVFDLANGKNFKLVIKQLGEFPNYDSSTFMDITPISIHGKKAPVVVDDKGKNKISNPKVQEKIKDFLLDRTIELDDHKAKEWTDDDAYKVSQIVEILNGNEIHNAMKQASKSSMDDTKNENKNSFGVDDDDDDIDDAGDFFEIDEQED